MANSGNRLRWFGHVSRGTESINEAMKLDVVGHRGRGRPKKTWAGILKLVTTCERIGSKDFYKMVSNLIECILLLGEEVHTYVFMSNHLQNIQMRYISLFTLFAMWF